MNDCVSNGRTFELLETLTNISLGTGGGDDGRKSPGHSWTRSTFSIRRWEFQHWTAAAEESKTSSANWPLASFFSRWIPVGTLCELTSLFLSTISAKQNKNKTRNKRFCKNDSPQISSAYKSGPRSCTRRLPVPTNSGDTVGYLRVDVPPLTL